MRDLKPGRGAVARACALLAIAAAVVSPAIAADRSAWQHQQQVAVTEPGFVRLQLAASSLDSAAATRADFRLVDPSGQEVPYSLEIGRSAPRESLTPSSFSPRVGPAHTVLLVRTGTPLPLASLELSTQNPRFLKSALVEASPDGESWTTLARDLPVFRQWGAQQLRLPLDGMTAAFVRVTLDDERSPPIAFTGATLLAATATPAREEQVGARVLSRDEFAGETVITLELEGRNLPLSRIAFDTDAAVFTRRVTVAERQVLDEKTTERVLGHGTIYRIPGPEAAVRESLAVALDCQPTTRQLLLHVHHGDSPPLPLSQVSIYRFQVALLCRVPVPGTYTLFSGNPQAAPPRYDLAELARDLRSVSAPTVTPGAVQANPGYRPPVALADVPLAGAPLDPEPWPLRKTIGMTEDGVQQLELDLEVLARARFDYGDLRLVRDGRQVPFLLESTGLTRPLELAPLPADDPKRPTSSRWKLVLPRDHLPLRRIAFISPTRLFQREVRVFERVSSDRAGTIESQLGRAAWSRRPGEEDGFLVCELAAAPQTDTLYLETENGDNPPIVLSHATATYPVVRLVFKARREDAVILLYGRADVGAPRYDLSLVAGELLAAARSTAHLGSEEKRADGLGASALASLRGGPVFWAALVLVVIVLFVVIARLLPKAPPAA